MSKPALEEFRSHVRAFRFPPVSDKELERLRKSYAVRRHINAIEGIFPNEETNELFEILFEERVPNKEWAHLLMGFTKRHSKSNKALI